MAPPKTLRREKQIDRERRRSARDRAAIELRGVSRSSHTFRLLSPLLRDIRILRELLAQARPALACPSRGTLLGPAGCQCVACEIDREVAG